MPAATLEAPAIIDAPATFPEFCNTVYPAQTVTLRKIREGAEMSGKKLLPTYRTIRFVPRKVGEREEGQRTTAIVHGFYTPIDQEEYDALAYECAVGSCPASEVDDEERRAYAVLRRKQEQQAQASHAGRPATRGQA